MNIVDHMTSELRIYDFNIILLTFLSFFCSFRLLSFID